MRSSERRTCWRDDVSWLASERLGLERAGGDGWEYQIHVQVFKFFVFTSDRIQSDLFDRHIESRFFSIVRIFLLLYYSTAESLYHRWLQIAMNIWLHHIMCKITLKSKMESK